jgi:benzoyl-CoA reductase/2-hydroxyglutaryl-CoA dehydratase subunit BcrC/BadD/HgdB
MSRFGSSAIGLTATVPVEVILAAGARPVDLNNVFIAHPDPQSLIADAERAGFPTNCCAWIKGIYAVVRRERIPRVIGVAQGDCSNTHALAEVLASEGVDVIAFNYPFPKDAADLGREIDALAASLGTTRDEAERARERLVPLRRTLAEIDRLTWQENRVAGEENHRWLLGSTDFAGDPDDYARRARAFLAHARTRPPRAERFRLGCLGIPPICDGLHEFLQSLGARVVFNEFQRQFSMPDHAPDLVDQYLAYTYPYGIEGRLDDVRRAVRRRRLDGLVHYVQSFCFRHIQDRLLRQGLDVPVLTLEFDRPGPLDGQSRTRIEAFIEMLASHAA